MNYNEYDSNGNKKKFNLIDIINDKQKRSRALLLIYLVFFVLLVIMIRFSLKSSLTNQENNQGVIDNNENIINNNQENIENQDDNTNELNEMFSNIDTNNYEFKYVIKYNGSISTVEGKRFNDKFSFTMENNGDILYFNGTSNYIKAKETVDGEYKLTGFPYVLVNIFDNNIIKSMISNSTLNNGLFEINNENISTITKKSLSNNDSINTMEVYLKENKINKIELDLSNAISSFTKETVKANISLEYSNFGLIEDFKIE